MRPTTIVLLVIMMLSLLAGWWFTNFERVERERYVGYSGEASYNRFFAAESLLQDRGLEADSQSSLTPTGWLPDYEDTLVVPLSPSLTTPDQASALQQWVVEGGHLVVLPYGERNGYARLLSPMGMRFVEHVPDYDDESDSADDEDSDTGSEEDYDYFVNLSGTTLRIEYTDQPVADATLSDDAGIIAARRTWGDGVVTLVAGDFYFDNTWLNDDDHARLLLDVVAGHYDPGKVWFIYSADFDSLFAIFWQNVPGTVVLFALLVIAWIASALPRFGPPVGDSPPERRSVVEHVRAAGLFDWRTGRAERLARSAIDALLHDAEIRHPGIGRLSPEKQARRLSTITGMDAESVLQALMLRDEDNARQFTQHMRTLQMTRDRL